MQIRSFKILFVGLGSFFSFNSFAQSYTLGTIPPGDSVVILYNVTIDNPIPAGVTQLSNQPSISGTNFSTFLGNDPASAQAGDPTLTPLNTFFLLPVNLLSFRGYSQNGQTELTWIVASQVDVDRYEIERSMDGFSYNKIGQLAASVTSSNTLTYKFSDINPGNGLNLYRLRMVDIDGKFKYSPILRINIAGKAASVSIYPNPVQNRRLTLNMSDLDKGTYQLRCLNAFGQVMYEQLIDFKGGASSEIITLPMVLAAGAYTMNIQGLQSTFTQRFIIK